MENTTHFVGAALLSAFIFLSVWGMYLYMYKRVSLDPHSAINHAISSRFDSVAEIHSYHAELAAEVCASANAALGRYQQAMQSEFAKMDPDIARHYPIPNARFEDFLPANMQQAAMRRPFGEHPHGPANPAAKGLPVLVDLEDI